MASYTQLEPNSFSALGVDTNTSFDGADVSFFATTSFLYTLFFIAIVGAAFYRYVLVGVYRMEASESGIRKSNETFKKTTLGLLGVFALFLIIATLNSQLLTGNVGLEDLRANPAAPAAPSTQSAPTTGTSPTTGTTPSTNSSYTARVQSHNSNVSRIAPSIKTNYNNVPCTEAQFGEAKPTCTSLAYMPLESINLLLYLNSQCGCVLVVTGGTEPGHLSHGENRRPIDLRIGGSRGDPNNSDKLYQFVKNSASNKLGPSSNCFERYLLNGFTFCDEKPPNAQHFHVY
jgi:hypothetical protein